MELSLFDYDFPRELVAQHPPPERDASRLLVLERRSGRREHRVFRELTRSLKKGDLLVFNDADANLIERDGRTVPPLPPYIKRKRPSDFTDADFERYRTIYARTPGSKAAPTAGFHFSPKLIEDIASLEVETAYVTLHIGFDTFKPIRTGDIRDHPMHGEQYEIPEATAEAVAHAKKEGRRVIAVGTTAVRALESWAACGESSASTHLFITPGYEFRIVDALVTNFHRPRSTVLVLVSAFAGRELILETYQEAIREGYRLFSYGDAMFIT